MTFSVSLEGDAMVVFSFSLRTIILPSVGYLDGVASDVTCQSLFFNFTYYFPTMKLQNHPGLRPRCAPGMSIPRVITTGVFWEAYSSISYNQGYSLSNFRKSLNEAFYSVMQN